MIPSQCSTDVYLISLPTPLNRLPDSSGCLSLPSSFSFELFPFRCRRVLSVSSFSQGNVEDPNRTPIRSQIQDDDHEYVGIIIPNPGLAMSTITGFRNQFEGDGGSISLFQSPFHSVFHNLGIRERVVGGVVKTGEPSLENTPREQGVAFPSPIGSLFAFAIADTHAVAGLMIFVGSVQTKSYVASTGFSRSGRPVGMP